MPDSVLRDIRLALAAQLEKQFAGNNLVVITEGDLEPSDPPAIVMRGFNIDNEVVIGGSSFMGELLLEVLVSKNNGWEDIEAFVSPIGELSIEAAIDVDNTLDGNIDDIRVTRIQNIGLHTYPAGSTYIGADVWCRFIKQILT